MNGNVPLDAATSVAQAAPPRRGKRPRRFVLPPLYEDDGRSVPAIETFLSHRTAADHSHDRPHRRRNRARRPAGARSVKTEVVLELDGFAALDGSFGREAATRITGAFVEAVWRVARSGDQVRLVEDGRVVLRLECDRTGAESYVERVRSAVHPWLDALGTPVFVSAAYEAVTPEQAPPRSR
jgi:hypothetical protein